MPGFGAIGEFAIGEVGQATAETILTDKWFVQLSEPVRFLSGTSAARQQFGALADPFPFVPFGWFEELNVPPVRTRPGLRPGLQQFIAWQPAPSPFVATGWLTPLNEPRRERRGVNPPWQQFGAYVPTVIPTSKLIEWFNPLSEPVRFRRGMKPPLQQFIAAPV